MKDKESNKIETTLIYYITESQWEEIAVPKIY